MFPLPLGCNINNLIDDLKIISWKACDIFHYYSKKIKENNFAKEFIEYKSKDDPVTIADLKVNNLVITEINKKYSHINWSFLSEEKSLQINENSEALYDWMWVLDPLDGTRDFIQNTGDYAMHLALNFKNNPILGIVLIPSREELWIADGKNVWFENRDSHKQKTNFSTEKNINNMTIVTSKNHKNKELEILINEIGFARIKSMGSIGCKIASIMRGESDIYISLSLRDQSSPKDWDFAAPDALLSLAGGRLTNLRNERLVYNKEGNNQGGIIIASNDKKNHKKLCLQVEKAIQKYKIIPDNYY